MNGTPFYRELSFWVALLAIVYTLALVGGTHWPREPFPELMAGRRDKLMHLLAYGGLTLLWSLAARAMWKPSWPFFGAIAVSVALFGATDELTQMLVPGRSCDLHDWIADLIGMTFGLGFFALTQAIWGAESREEKIVQDVR